VARWLIQNDKDMAVQDLTAKDPRKLASEQEVHYYYMQSVSLVDFLMRRYGAKAFTDFCRELRDGKRFDQALRSSYLIENQWELQEKWHKDAIGEVITPELELYSLGN